MWCDECNSHVKTPHECTVSVPRSEWESMVAQVNDIHQFIQGISGALQNPMFRAMLPPDMRNVMG